MIERIKNSNVLIILLILIVTLAAFAIFFFASKRNIVQNVVDKKYFLSMYKCDDDSVSPAKSDNCQEELYKIPTETKDAKFLNVPSNITRYVCQDGTLSYEETEDCKEIYDSIDAGEDSNIISGYSSEYLEIDFDLSNYIVYEDNGLKFYNNKTKEITPLKLKGNYDYFDMIFNEDYYLDDAHSIDGMIFYKENGNKYDCVYYDMLNAREMYKDEYDFIEPLLPFENEYLIAFKFDKNDDKKAKLFVLSKKEEKVYFSVDSEKYAIMTLEEDEYGRIWILEDSNTHQFFNKDFAEITPKMTEENYYYDYADFITIKRNNNLEVYDLKGNLRDSYVIKGDLKEIEDKIYVTVINDMLSIVNYEGEVLKEVCPWSINNKYYQENYWIEEEYYDAEEDENGSYIYFSIQDTSNNTVIQYRFEKNSKELISHNIKEIPDYYMLEEEE